MRGCRTSRPAESRIIVDSRAKINRAVLETFESHHSSNNLISLRMETSPFTLWGFRFRSTCGASDGLPTAYQGENRQKAEALHEV